MAHTTTLTPPSFDSFVPSVTQHKIDTKSIQTYMPVRAISSNITTQAQNIIFSSVWPSVVGVSTMLSLGIAVAILYAVFRVKQIREAEKIYYANQPMTAEARHTFGVDDAPAGGAAGLVRWQEIGRHLQSDNTASWKQAILEADVMLDDVISSKGYTGESLGEKMKQVSRSDINSIDDAWEAHKVRNRIAHDGSSFDISKRDAKRTIALYENVFRELAYIPS